MDTPNPIVEMTKAIVHRMSRLIAFSKLASLVAMACAALASAYPSVAAGIPIPFRALGV